MKEQLSWLSNAQLYAIIQNDQLDKSIRKEANLEFAARNLPAGEVEMITSNFESSFQPNKDARLNTGVKILLITIPFPTIIHSLISLWFLAKNQKKKWKEYWLYVCLGFLFWTVIVMIIAKVLNESSQSLYSNDH